MNKAIRRLRLRKGDAILASDMDVVKAVMHSAIDLGFNVPIIMLPPGRSLKRISKEYLKKLLGRSE